MKSRSSFATTCIFLAIIALCLGGLGGSLQPSRLLLIPLLPIILTRIGAKSAFPYQNQTLIFLILTSLIAILSLAWSVDKITSAGYIMVLLLNTSPVAMVALMKPWELQELRRILPKAWFFSALIVLPIALYEIITGEHFDLDFENRGGGISSLLPFAAGLHGNYNDFSVFLIFCFFGVIFTSQDIQKPWRSMKKMAINLVLLGIAAVVFLNASRGAVLTLVGFFIAKFLMPLSGKKLGAFLVFLATSITLFSFKDQEENLLSDYIFLKFTDFSNDLHEDEGRLSILRAGIRGIRESLGLGVGAGASSVYLAASSSLPIPNPHNIVLEWVLNFGVYGLALFGWFLFKLWKNVGAPEACGYRRMVRAFIVLLPVFGVVQSHLTGYTYFWLILCTVLVFAAPISKSQGNSTKTGSSIPST